MTIKELEQAVGMTRANIRFYEQEGLLSPARTPNGYRDYSEADMETLKKIKLLRSLDMDLETIRALQSGEQTLPQALREQLARLEADETALAGAKEVCGRLRGEWLSYDALDAGPWLEKLELPPAPEGPDMPRAQRPMPADPFQHPWRRYFARSLDLGLYGLVIEAALSLGLHVPIQALAENLTGFFLSWLACVPMLLLEPFMLSRWGTTPGKALFGIRVLDDQGQRMSLRQARERTREVFARGMGYGVPLYGLWREYKSWRACRDWEWHDWETWAAGEPERMTISGKAWRCWAYVGVRAALYALAFLIACQSLMPPNRGELDLAEFCENVNFYNRYLSYGEVPFTPEGVREERPGTEVYVDPTSHDYYDEAWSPIEENGETVGFRYTLSARGKGFDSGVTARQLGVLAYAGSLPETSCLTLVGGGWETVLYDLYAQGWEFDFVHRGVRMTQSVEYRGVEDLQDRAWGWGWVTSPDMKTDIVMELEFTIRRAEDTKS